MSIRQIQEVYKTAERVSLKFNRMKIPAEFKDQLRKAVTAWIDEAIAEIERVEEEMRNER